MLSQILTSNSIAEPPLTFMCSGASPEWKLNMAMLLQAVFEQDEQFCTSDASAKYQDVDKHRLADRARKYVKSDDFTEMCNLTGVDASFMRVLTPLKAREAYSKLMDQTTTGYLSELLKRGHSATTSAGISTNSGISTQTIDIRHRGN